MSERLFIRLGQTAEQPCFWLIWSQQEQEIIASGELKNAEALSSLSERAANRPVDVLVPSAAITLTQVELPEKGQRQAIKALPFMLEESLAQNVDELHFVTGPRSGDALSIGVVAHEQMQLWLAWLADADLKPKHIVPDCLALPLAECDWAAMQFDKQLLLRTGEGRGASLPEPWVNTLVPKMLTSSEAAPTVANYTEMALEGVELQPQPLELPMLVLAKGLLAAPMNLLSGVYTPKREYGKHLMQWRNVAILFVVAFIFALVNKGLDIYQINARTQHLKVETEMVFKQNVPNSSRIVNIRAQMNDYVRSLQGHSGGNEFFTMLQGMKPAFDEVKALKPTSLRFDGKRGEIRMQVAADKYEQIEKFKEIIARDYRLADGAMNSSDNKVISTLTIRNK